MNLNICRVCMCSLNGATQVVHIFDDLYRNNYNLVALISELFDVKIGINDVLSKVICQYCADQIVEFYKFHDMLLESDRKLRWEKIQENVTNITEPILPEILLPNDSVKEEICVEDESISALTCDDNIESHALLDNHGCDDATDKFEKVSQEHSTNCTFKESTVADPPIKIDRKSTNKCQKCKMNFASKCNLERHIKNKHELSSIVQCEQCEATFVSKFNLKRHIQHTHEKSSNHACEDAKGKFKTENLKRHIIKHRHTKSSNHACEDAKDKFENKAQIHNTNGSTSKKSSVTGTPTKMYRKSTKKCKICKMTFVNNYNLERHIQYKHELLTVQCGECEATFASKFNLNRHIQYIHAKSSNHTCEDAKEKFENKVQRHSTDGCKSKKSSVTGTPTKICRKSTKTCKICKMTFATNFNLERHIKNKHELSIVQCDECKATFESKFNLIRHLRYGHENSSTQKCHICHGQFSTAYGLKRHVKNVHSDIHLSKSDAMP